MNVTISTWMTLTDLIFPLGAQKCFPLFLAHNFTGKDYTSCNRLTHCIHCKCVCIMLRHRQGNKCWSEELICQALVPYLLCRLRH